MEEILLLSDNDITTNTILGGNIDVDRYRYCVQDAQLSSIIEMIGEDLYDKMKADFGNYEGLYAEMYPYLRIYLIHQSATEFLKTNSYHVGNGGTFKHAPSNGTIVEKSEVDYLVQNSQFKADIYSGRLERWLCKYGSGIPEYKCSSDNIVNPRKSNNLNFDFL